MTDPLFPLRFQPRLPNETAGKQVVAFQCRTTTSSGLSHRDFPTIEEKLVDTNSKHSHIWKPSRRSVLGLLGAVPLAGALAAPPTVQAAPDAELAHKIEEIMARPAFDGARWGAQFYAPDTGQSIYALNTSEPFVAGSSSKVFVGGTAFLALGHNRRFPTRVYRTGPVRGGVLHGDLVLAAGGDLLLSGRLHHDGSLALPDPDHTYHTTPGAGPIGGDPLRELRLLATQVAARIERVEGCMLVDGTLYREGTESLANGVTATISPVMVNDNLVDVTVGPGSRPGMPAALGISPQSDYVRIVNDVRTIAASEAASARPLAFADDVRHPDGTRTVSLTGDITEDSPGLFRAYFVPEPAAFAQALFVRALHDEGVDVGSRPGVRTVSGPRHLVAEHLSPGLPDQLKPMLKVSSNLHTEVFPYLIGAIAGEDPDDPKAAGQQVRRELFERAGFDPEPPGSAQNRYTPQYFVEFLAYMARHPHFRPYRDALPILGRDGTLKDVQPDSPAAGHVYAKTGTSLGNEDGKWMNRQALAGYIELPSGRRLTFAAFVGIQTTSAEAAREMSKVTKQALGEIAAAAYITQSS
ncbi:D-alanyl-D-alanine carboxypeptidase/D-alanyl-D-alanine-endopeptidase [Nonomuraea sp. KC401]|uniref:D-alanyl-D-alanine carboxypeptidase/D-alanyl-D-alanine endopeptidase n=1 Tax=unclassified Nonomuraea TaxID=2593643 RepID=UPI0010FD5989|nr:MULTISPECIES: D-alanyl-D-alanine carboxypeptidase/D-alanyl-D-alanine-endopeptidase [unclassified Nonomuraea]NBE92384.1 D-alanyl-D-alanine carboxypeptidase/D-alanyl-D-alanine-endopeptidase [Nonomuraea sp. K271]TLF81818.1 D-alanyl-D-alanine carboxypeptidase/D-alanyl-D-alanine-endopeptidase [Nonomuraea sp. KC401]